NDEKHLNRIDYMTTLAGYIHWLLTGEKAIGIGDASGIFPIDESRQDYNEPMVKQFDDLIADKGLWKLKDILPKVLGAGEQAGQLTEIGARILDRSQ
ncbi:ATPase, partial [Bacillus altitudinis]